MIKRRYPKKKQQKTSALTDLRNQKIMGVVAAVCIIVMVVIVGMFTPVLAKNIFKSTDSNETIDVELYQRYEEEHLKKAEAFDTLYSDFNTKYEEFLYAAYVVELSKNVYFNDKAVQEMNQYVAFYKSEAEELKEQAEYLNQTFRTPIESDNTDYLFLCESLNTTNTIELQKCYVELADITQSVNNSIVNVDIYNGYFFLEEDRKCVVDIAETLVGKITYQWGGKAANAGWNESWSNGGGLDCSGFVQWAYWTATGERIEEIGSTYSISLTQEPISYSELKPGDLGMMEPDGTYYTDTEGNKFYSYEEAAVSNELLGYTDEEAVVETHTNHVGIYAGKDIYGNDIWVHCTGKPKNTVVKEEFPRFQYFYRVETQGEPE